MTFANRIADEMKRQNLTQEDLAARAGISQAAIHKILAGKTRNPTSLYEIAQVLGVSVRYLKTGDAADFPAPPAGLADDTYTGSHFAQKSTVWGKIPVLGYASGSGDNTTAINWDHDAPVDWVDPIPGLEGVNKASALMILGDSMEPRYRAGEIIFVNRAVPPRPRQDCVIDTKNGETHIKEFVSQDKEFIHVRQFNPAKTLQISKTEITGLYAVVGRK